MIDNVEVHSLRNKVNGDPHEAIDLALLACGLLRDEIEDNDEAYMHVLEAIGSLQCAFRRLPEAEAEREAEREAA